MRLYYSPAACSLASNITFAEAGVPYEMTKVDLGKGLTEDGQNFNQINSKGYVPFLDLGNQQSISEGAAILQFIADSKPDSGLAPRAGTMERVKFNEWLTYISTEVHKTLGGLFDRSMPDTYKAATIEKIGKRLDWLTTEIGSKPFLMGETFTAADAYLFTVLNWGQWVGVDLKKWPMLSAYQARVAARPKVQEAMKVVGLAG
jgi:glutathione S-transferase